MNWPMEKRVPSMVAGVEMFSEVLEVECNDLLEPAIRGTLEPAIRGSTGITLPSRNG